MDKRVLLFLIFFLLFFFFHVGANAQQSYPYYGKKYVIHYFDDSFWVSQCGCPYNAGSESTLNLDSSGKPLVVDITTQCAKPNSPVVNKYCSFDLSTADCYSDAYISWEPYNLTLNGPAPDVYCASQALTINGSDGYQSYSWEYLIINSNGNSGWKPLSAVSGSSFTFNLSNIPGATFGDNIYFRYSVSGCAPKSAVIGPYSFLQNALYVTDVSMEAPTCAGGTDGSVQVTLNRALYPNELIDAFNFFTSNNYKTTKTTLTDPQSGVTYERTNYDLPSIAYPVGPVAIDGNNQGKINNIPVGTGYILVTTNEGGCGAPNFSPAATVPNGPRIPISATLSIGSDYHGSSLSCNNTSDGELKVSTVKGGDGTYKYSVNNGPEQSSNLFSSLGAGSYTVTIKDGCATPTTATTNTVVINAPLPVAINSLNPSLCNGSSNGQIAVNASGGTGQLSYSLDGINYQSGNTFTGLAPGSYTVSVRDENNCSITGSVVVASPVKVGTVSIIHPTCSGSNSGVITLSGASGGTGVLNWSIGAQFQSATSSFANVAPGTYTATVRDANNCTATSAVVVNEPIGASYVATLASCASLSDGTLAITNATGGTGTYQYELNNGAYQSSVNFSGLAGGSYTINIKDGNSCMYSISNAAVNLKPAVTGIITQITPIKCNGEKTATLSVSAAGGTAPYLKYDWSNLLTGPSITNVGAGNYSATITDSKGCQGTASATVIEPKLLTTTVKSSDYNGYGISCTGGSNGTLLASAEGGTSSYMYSWSTGSTAQNISNLKAGYYSVTVTDANGCISNATTTLTEPANALEVKFKNKKEVTCFGGNDGQIVIEATGGVGAKTYNLGTVFQISPTFGALKAGSYTFNAEDENGCKAISETITITSPDTISMVVTKEDPTCQSFANGKIIIISSGGVQPHKYSLDGINFVSTTNFDQLTEGGYTITLVDANGCTNNSSIQNLTDPPQLTVSAVGESESVLYGHDGEITVNASGGSGTLSYSLDGVNYQSSPGFTNLSAGTYTVSVKDNHACSQEVKVVVDAVPPPPSSMSCSSGIFSVSLVDKVEPSCGQTNGSLKASVSGGTAPYTYHWYDNLGKSLGANADLQNVSPGTYRVIVQESNQCAVSTNVTFAAYVAASYNVSVLSGSKCIDSSDGSATVNVKSAASPYSISWSSGETTVTAKQLKGGSNKITFTDANGCVSNKNFNVPSPSAVSIAKEVVTDPVCADGNQGTIQVTAAGGMSPYGYSWNGVAGANNIQQVKAGKYELKISDTNGCSLTKNFTLVDPPAFTIDLAATKTICPNTVTQIGLEIANATYQWTGPSGFTSTQGVVTVKDGGDYQLTVTSGLGCKASSTVKVEVSNTLLKADLLATSKASVGDTVVVIDISWPLPDKIEWVLPDSAEEISSDQDYSQLRFDKAGTYVVGIKSTLGGCADSHFQSIEIEEKKSKAGGREANGGGLIVTVFPNPFETTAEVTIEQREAEEIAMEVYELGNNEKIMSHAFSGSRTYQAELNFSNLKSGVYVVVLKAKVENKVIRVIKL